MKFIGICNRGFLFPSSKCRLGGGEIDEVDWCVLCVATHLRACLSAIKICTIISTFPFKDSYLYFFFGFFFLNHWLFLHSSWFASGKHGCQRILEIVIIFLYDWSQATATHWHWLTLYCWLRFYWVEWLYFLNTSLISLILLALLLLFDILREFWQTAGLDRSSWRCNFFRLFLFLPLLLC